MTREELGFVGGRQVAVVRNALVEIVRHEVEDVFFEVGAGAADAVNLVLADHLGERQAELGGAHGAGDGDEHFAARSKVRDIAICCVNKGCGVEVAIVMLDE